jgi:membrane protein DedA with SNARE-associated domain
LILVASSTSTITGWIAQHGIVAVFALMALDALLPVGGEVVMLYAGVLASGAIVGHHVSLLGHGVADGGMSYLVLALAGTLGYLGGALLGWGIGRYGGRSLVERHERWFHLDQRSLVRAESWFERFGTWAVLLGRITPVVRSFISIPAGVFRAPLTSYVPLSLAGSAIWCFAFAGAGWGLGGRWESFHKNFRYADALAIAAILALLVIIVLRALRRRRLAAR